MRAVAIVLAFMCFGCAASIAPSNPPISVSLLNNDFEQLKQDEKDYWEDNARAIDAVKAFQRKVEVFRGSLTKTEQGRFDQFWEKPSQEAAWRIPDIPSVGITEFRQQYPQYNDMSDRDLAGRIYAKYYAGKLPKEKFMDSFLNPKAGKTAIVNPKIFIAIELQNKRADFWKLANSFDEREKELKARRATLEQQRRDNIAHLETLAALGDIQQAQMLNTLLMMTPTPAARAPLPPPYMPPPPVFPAPPQRGIITGPGGTYYYRGY